MNSLNTKHESAQSFAYYRKFFNSTTIRLFIICIVAILSSVYCISLKEDFNVDEYFTYALSNYTGNGLTIAPEIEVK